MSCGGAASSRLSCSRRTLQNHLARLGSISLSTPSSSSSAQSQPPAGRRAQPATQSSTLPFAFSMVESRLSAQHGRCYSDSTVSSSAQSSPGMPAKGKGRGSEKKSPPTHFLCIPLVTDASRPQLEASMARFRREVLGEEEGSGESDQTKAKAPFSPSAVRPVGTLHLTLGVMSLRDDESMARALELLRSLDLSALLRQSKSTPNQPQPQPEHASGAAPSSEQENASPHPPPLVLSLRGLRPMQSPGRSSILYAAPHDPTARLFAFASAVRNAFAPLLVHANRALRLHATVVNTIYAKDGQRRGGGGEGGAAAAAGKKRTNDSLRFDATELIDRFADLVWAEGVKVQGVAVCEMGARDLGEGRGVAYREVACVGFDESVV